MENYTIWDMFIIGFGLGFGTGMTVTLLIAWIRIKKDLKKLKESIAY